MRLTSLVSVLLLLLLGCCLLLAGAARDDSPLDRSLDVDDLGALLDRLAVESLITSYTSALDDRRWDVVEALFTDDAQVSAVGARAHRLTSSMRHRSTCARPAGRC